MAKPHTSSSKKILRGYRNMRDSVSVKPPRVEKKKRKKVVRCSIHVFPSHPSLSRVIV